MATAVEPGSEPRTPSAPPSLPLASLLGALYVVLALAVVFKAVPMIWGDTFGNRLQFLGTDPLRILAQLVAVIVLLLFGRGLLGSNPPKGIHGGIFLWISWGITVFFLWRAVALNVSGMPGLIISGLAGAFLVLMALRFMNGPVGKRWAIGLEEQGWFSTATYKRSLGQKVRRLTILGILLIGGSGVYSLWFQDVLPRTWKLAMPYEWNSITVLTDANYTIPLLLAGLTLWVAWRAVNAPSFAEFLIATEAEMNKVSWTPRKRLFQDTVVVLITTFMLAVFLLVVDLFWGWLLSRQMVGVLPGKSTGGAKEDVEIRW